MDHDRCIRRSQGKFNNVRCDFGKQNNIVRYRFGCEL